MRGYSLELTLVKLQQNIQDLQNILIEHSKFVALKLLGSIPASITTMKLWPEELQLV